ncbi:CD2 antigen cytoplasmic tail-binding protein 2 -like protein [Halotydeus destructor]|nr:CD2 antigen cytoplasmic tail-binding protein 2 -like protein [Halotydeus destructor]
MSKRKVNFNEDLNEIEVYEPDEGVEEEREVKRFPLDVEEDRPAKKHTLDSDEEEEDDAEDKYKVDPDDIEGAEDGVAHVEDEVKITPFNMKEELEEGFLDKDGSYVFDKKKQNELKDSWLDNIDWMKVDPKVAAEAKTDQIPEPEVNVIETYKTILQYMKPRESIKKTIQRLGLTTKKYKGKKDSIPPEILKDKETLGALTSLANQILISGDMDIYEKTFEQLNHLVKQEDADPLDMFGDADCQPSTSTGRVSAEDSVQWEFKWENTEEAEKHGPVSNDQMKVWQGEGYFEAGVWVRQLGKSDSQFYNSKRIDFELYS